MSKLNKLLMRYHHYRVNRNTARNTYHLACMKHLSGEKLA